MLAEMQQSLGLIGRKAQDGLPGGGGLIQATLAHKPERGLNQPGQARIFYAV